MIGESHTRLLWIRIALLYLSWGLVGCEKPIESGVSKFPTAWLPWIGQGDAQFDASKANPGGLMMRQLKAGQQDLLLARREGAVLRLSKATAEWVVTEEMKRFPVYRYRPESDTLDAVSQESWDRAAGDIVECDLDDLSAIALYINPEKYRFEIQGRPIATIAPLAVGARLSRGGRFAAVLSGEQRSDSFMPFLSGGTAKGRHYHQILDVTSRVFQEPAVPIPLVSEGGLQCCWSPDDRYVVYYSGSEVAIVPFEPPADAASPE